MKLPPTANRCFQAATNLGPEDTSRFIELHDTYTKAGMPAMDAARQAASDLVAEIEQEAKELDALVAPLRAQVEAAATGGMADSVPQTEVEAAGASADTPIKEANDDPPPAGNAPAVDQPLDQGLLGDGQDAPARGGRSARARAGRADDGVVRRGRQRDRQRDDAAGGEPGVGDGGSDLFAAPEATGSLAADRRGVPPDYRPEPGGLSREGSWFDAAKRNLDLIDLARKIDAEGRPATADEQAQLAKYVGFGAGEIRNAMFPVPSQWQRQQNPDRLIFPDGIHDKRWKALAERAAALPIEWQRSILQTTQYAHYTSENVVRAIWTGMQRLGFTGGKVLEPGVGIGNFAMLMPEDVHRASVYTGLEFDAPTALIARLLSPQQNMLHADFIKRQVPRDFFDVAIGNPPFSQTKVLGDPDYEKHGFMLHDFFFAKSIDRVRPGGLLAFVTSKGTMDKQSDRARKYLAARADLLGAIRLPSTAFEGNAGTSVITDVIFLRKRAEGEQEGGAAWRGLKTVDTPDGPVVINEYFADHPDMVLGQNRISGNTDDQGRRINSNGYGGEKYTVVSYDATPAELDAKFLAAIDKLPANVYSALSQDPASVKRETARIDFDPKVKREGVVYLADDGTLMRVKGGVGKPLADDVKLSDKDAAWMADFVGLRGMVQEARAAQFNDGDWKPALKAANDAYDAFRAKHGPIHDFRTITRTSRDEEGNEVESTTRIYKNRRLWIEDYDAAIVRALEDIDEQGEIHKAKFLLGRTIGKPVVPEVRTVADALAVSLDAIGSLDLADVARRMSISRDEVIDALGDSIYKAPSGKWTLADEYLSGDVVKKLEEAEEAARVDPSLKRNVAALKAVQPERLGPSQISVKLGASWVSAEVVNEFAEHIGAGAVTFDPKTESWQVEGGNLRSERRAGADFGTAKRSPSELLEAGLNSRVITIKGKADGKEYTDKESTDAANEMLRKIKDEFKSWVWQDSERAAQLVDAYNLRFNNIAPRRFDGSHLTLPGLRQGFKPHPHQLRAIWRQIQTGNTYLAHAVGAGKTFEMIAGGMEQKRLGLIKKPMYVVPNHMLEQFANEFMEFYPLANIMVADDENFSAERRKAFVAAAALNNPDAIVITHSAFERIGVSEESVAPIRDELLADLQDELDAVAKDSGQRVRRSQLQQQIEAIEQRFDSIVGAGKKDSTVKFEDVGVDFVYVDEAHAHRKLDFATNQSIKGIDPNGSRRALDLYVKTRWLESKRPGRSKVFASGTPVTNTMGELYTLMRFFADDELHRGGMATFDAWARNFGEAVPALEANAAGRYEVVTRFAKFDNVPELMSRVRQFMDVLTSDQLGSLVKRPDIEGGKPDLIAVEPTAALKGYMKNVLLPRLEASRRWKPSKDEPTNPDPVIAITTDGRFAALDPRFIGGKLGEGETTKLEEMAAGIAGEYTATAGLTFVDKAGKAMPAKGGTQVVFYNLGFGEQSMRNRGFDARSALVRSLTSKGVKREHIAFFDDANTDAKKEAIFKAMRQGQVRILIGSAKKMGTGVNVQNRLTALHYFDPPWFPSDVEQPHGRILRQGNQNEVVRIKWYATKGTYDSTMWQMVARKQRFIDQAFSGDRNLRTMEDMSEASQFEQAAAVASGDPRALQLAGLKQDVERFERLQAAHTNEQINVRSALRQAEWEEKYHRERAARYARAVAALNTNYVTYEAGEIGGVAYKKAGEWGEALKAAFNKAAAEGVEDRDLGTMNGVIKVRMDQRIGEKGPTGSYDLSIEIGGVEFSLETSGSAMGADVSAVGLSQRVTAAANSADREVRRSQTAANEQATEVVRLRKKLGAPFEHQQALLEKHAELLRLQEELRAEGEAANAAAARAAAAPVQPVDDDGSPVASRAAAPALRADPAAIRALAQSFADAGLKEVKVADTAADLPADQRRRLEAAGMDGARGVYFPSSDEIWLIADQLRSVDDAAFVAFHEAFHRGLRRLFPDDAPALLQQMWRTNQTLRQRTAAIQDALKIGRDEAIEEALADMAGEGQARALKGFDKLVALIRTWLAKLSKAAGIELTFTDAMIETFVAGTAGEGLRRAPPTDPADPDIRASRAIPSLRSIDQQQVRDTLADMLGAAGSKVSWFDKTLATQYAKAERLPAFKQVFDRVQGYLEDVSTLANTAADAAPQILPKLETWRDMRNIGIGAADAKAIAGPVFEGTLNYVREDGKLVTVDEAIARAEKLSIDDKAQRLLRDGHFTEAQLKAWRASPLDTHDAAVENRYQREYLSAGVVFTDAELRERFKLDDKQVGLYRQFRAAVDASLDHVAASEALRLIGPEAPAQLKALALNDPQALRAAIEELLAENPDSNDLWNDIADKFNKVERLKRQGYAPLMRFGKYKVHVSEPDTGETLFFGLYETRQAANAMTRELRADPEFAKARFEQGVLSQKAYELFAGVPTESLEMFASAIGADKSEVFQQYLRLTKNNRSALKRLIHRKGTAGFSDDVPRVLASFVTSNSRLAAAGMNLPAANAAAESIREGDVQDEAVALIQAVQKPTEAAAGLRGLMFMNFIGGSIASALVNATQPITMTLPYLTQWGGLAKATARLIGAGKSIATGSMDAATRAALKRAEDEGIVSPQEIHHLRAQASASFGAHPLLRRVAFIWAAPFSLAEQWNRRVSFVAAFNTAREQGMADPFAFAHKAVVETQGLYNKGNAPNWARGPVGALALQFKQYSIHYLEWLTRMYKSGPEGKKAVLIALALLMMVGGAEGLPFAEDINDLADTLTQALGLDMGAKDAKRRFIAEQLGLGDMAADVVMRGLSSLPGMPMDVSLRMGMGSLIPGTGLLLRSNTDRSRDVLEVVGPIGGAATQYKDAALLALGGDVREGITKALPTAAQNFAKAAGMWQTGEARDDRGRKVMPASEVDGLMRFLGFNPAEIAAESQRLGRIRRSEQLAKNVEGDIVERWARGVVDGEPDKVQAAREELAEWNRANPQSPIRVTPQQIRGRVRAMRQTRSERFIKSVSPERRGAVADAVQ